MRNTSKPSCLLAKRAERKRRARWKRLRIERRMMGNWTQESDAAGTGDGQCFMRKRRTSFKEIPSCESQNVTRKDVDFSGELTSVNIPSDSGSGTPVSQLTGSGDEAEGTLVEESIVCRVKESENLDYLSHGLVSVIGRRRVMEDAVAVEMGIAGGKFAYFAVYDGHGGSAVAMACSVGLHKLLANEIETSCGGFDWAKMMSECFKKMDEEVNECFCGGSSAGGGPARMVGSTAVVVVVGKEEVVVANCGDSRAIMCRGGIAVALSHDHKPDRPDERERVEAAGRRIINWNGNRVLGVLATSRSIGDQHLKPYVISEPEVTVSKRTVADDFIIIASDGLWDVVSNELACEVVKLCLIGRIKKKLKQGTTAADAAAILVELAIAGGSKDNISVIVVELKKNPALTPLDLPDQPHSDL